ncbi:MAG: beta-ketoacyl-ACP synthase II [bacterium]
MRAADIRVVVTGMGVVSPVGIGVSAFWDSVVNGRSGIKPITHFDASSYPSRIAGMVEDFDPSQILDPNLIKHTSMYEQFALVAMKEAMAQSGLVITEENAYEVASVIGSGIGGFEIPSQQYNILKLKGVERLDPYMIIKMIADGATSYASIECGAKGPKFAPVAACASSTIAIGEAYEIIKRDDAVAAITGGSESAVTDLGLGSFVAARALSKRNDNPETVSRPFDQNRDGMVMSEGAAIFVLEERNTAMQRGANILAEVVGYGNTSDAYNTVLPDPSGEGAARAMMIAMRKADLGPDHIGYISAHGTSTPAGDPAEVLAIRQAFAERLSPPPVSSIKGPIGHTLGASGAIALVACIMAMHTRTIPPTTNLEHIDPACEGLDHVANIARVCPTHLHSAMVNSFGFGGHNASLVVTRP